MTEDATFMYHEPCDCGSSDGRGVYDDGHKYCFVCDKWFPPDGEEAHTHTPAEPAQTAVYLIPGSHRPLNTRGLKVDTCRKFDYTVAKLGDEPVQIANYRDLSGGVAAQHIRFKDKSFIWKGDSKNVQLFGQNLYGAGGKRIIITEGEIDCMTIAQAFGLSWPVVSIPSGIKGAKKILRKHLEWCESFGEIVIAFDDDAPGREGIEDCASLFTPGRAKVMRYGGYKDANELFLAKGAKAVVNEVFNAEVYRPDGIVNSSSLWGVIQEPPQPGLQLPYPYLDSMLNGHRPGEITMFTAGSGIGKSTVVHEIAYHLMMEHNQTIGVMALEENVRKATERYLSIHMNHPLHLNREGITDDKLEEAFKVVCGSDRLWLYDHFGSTQIDNLLAKVRFMVVGLGVHTVVLDHISIVVSALDEGLGTSERKMIDQLMTKLRSLVEETQASILAVVHLKRPDKGRSYNEGRKVSLTDLRGSAALEQLSDNVIALERNQQNEEAKNDALIRVLKCRQTGETGKADVLRYNKETGRLLPVPSEFADVDDSEEFNVGNHEDF